MRIEDLLGRLKSVKQTGQGNWSACCPAHDDHKPSLGVKQVADGRIFLKCFSQGCGIDELCKAIGITQADLRNNSNGGSRKLFYDYPAATPDALRRFWLAKKLPGQPDFLVAGDVRLAKLRQGEQLRFLVYDGQQSQPCGCVRAMADGSLVQTQNGAEKYPCIGQAGLLGLDCIKQAETVLLAEGLKDYLSARALGFAAASGSAGAGTFKLAWVEHFRSKRVSVVYDLDDAGRNGAKKAAAMLAGVAAEVKIITLPGTESGYDLSDYIMDSNTAEDIQQLIFAAEAYRPDPAAPSEAAPQQKNALTYHLTDSGNAELMEAMHADKLKYDWTSKVWLFYDGQRWSKLMGEAMARRLAVESARHRLALAESIEDTSERKRYVKHAFSSEGRAAVESCLSLARSLPGFAVQQNQFDQDDYLLNVLNGTIDLKTGKLRPHNPVDMLTMLAPVKYPETSQEARCDLWLQCLNTWHKGNQNTTNYLQRLAGMCLTGDISSRRFPIFYGGGKNGKSVFLVDVLMAMLGDYGCKAPRSLLKATVNEQHPTDIAGLMGKRLVAASETDKNMKLNVSLVKEMTGDAILRARFMRGDFFDFKPTHHTVLMTQNLPVIDESADAIWDRVHKIEWPVRIPANMQDCHLAEKLRANWPGILKWAVEGCLQWQKDGDLFPTDEIRLQTDQYRAEQNPLHDFIQECCVVGEGLLISVTDLLDYFKTWARVSGLETAFHGIDAREFSRLVTDAGFTKKNARMHNDSVCKCWTGIGIRSSDIGDDIPI